jgi:hypothetical protein
LFGVELLLHHWLLVDLILELLVGLLLVADHLVIANVCFGEGGPLSIVKENWLQNLFSLFVLHQDVTCTL